MPDWNAAQYLKYGAERTRAAEDLLARVALEAPSSVVDLGCGPGNSTRLLWERWPNADVTGLDRSPDMVDAARAAFPGRSWATVDIADWTPARPMDVAFSNAALQWLSGHDTLIPRLFSMVAPGGALAFQIPGRRYAPVRALIDDVSREPRWNDRLEAARRALTMESPAFYYDVLSGVASSLDVWETQYVHVLESPAAVVDWMAGTGLRPYLQALADEAERQAFLEALRPRVREAYGPQPDGRVLFPFNRTFVIAWRQA
ncbi:MAG: methyltransferase domain-containing protein [Vicinamibacterales bacterium]